MEERQQFFLAEWRKHRGLSQQALADAMGTSKGYISELERGVRRYNQDLLESAAKALDCSPGDLLSVDPRSTQKEQSAELIDIWDHMNVEAKDDVLDFAKWRRDRDAG